MGSTQLEVQEITCRGTKNLNNSTGFFQDFSHALQDSFAQNSILDRPSCGVIGGSLEAPEIHGSNPSCSIQTCAGGGGNWLKLLNEVGQLAVFF